MHCTERVRDAFSCVRWRKMNLTRRVLVHRPLAHFFPQISLSFIFLAYISHPAMQHRTPLTPIPQNRSPPLRHILQCAQHSDSQAPLVCQTAPETCTHLLGQAGQAGKGTSREHRMGCVCKETRAPGWAVVHPPAGRWLTLGTHSVGRGRRFAEQR